jgi:AraC family transcriptional regulator of arabinose operon
MHKMTKFMDYMISPYPIRVIDRKVDPSRLMRKSLMITNVGHLPGRTLHRKHAIFSRWAIVYISGGRGTYQVNDGVKQVVEEGSLFLFYPGVEFHFGPENGGYWDEYYFNIESERIVDWLSEWQLVPGAVLRVGTDEAQQNKIDRILMLMESGIPANLDRASLLLESVLFEFIWMANRPPESTRSQQMIDIMEDMSSFLYEPVNPDKIAKRHHISLSTLRRNVAEYTGYPFNEYLHRLKTAEAKNILINTELSIKEIAGILGYKDVFYFSRLFKKFVGIAPDSYRKSI